MLLCAMQPHPKKYKLMHGTFLSREQRLRRSYILYDKNCSGKITKEEMVETLSDLGKVKTTFDEKGKPKIPDDVENLFRQVPNLF